MLNQLTTIVKGLERTLNSQAQEAWHAKHKDTPYLYVAGLPIESSEDDVMALFHKCGGIVDFHLVRDEATGKSKGIAFVVYENPKKKLNGTKVSDQIIRVDHVKKYKKKEEDGEAEWKKREAQVVCQEFKKGYCYRGDACMFYHDVKQRAAKTGLGADDTRYAKWGHGKYE